MTQSTRATCNSPPKGSDSIARTGSGRKRLRAAFASRWAFSPLPSISSRSFAARRIQPRSRGACCWSCPALRCARRFRHRQEESRAHRHRTLCLHAQSALSRLHADRRRFCSGAAQLAGGAAACGWIRGHLHSGHRLGGAISARRISRVRQAIAAACRASSRASLRPRLASGNDLPAVSQPVTKARYRRLFVRPLPQAPRVQCCIRGRTAVPEPALPAAGAGESSAPGLVSAFRRIHEVQQRMGQVNPIRSRAEH